MTLSLDVKAAKIVLPVVGVICFVVVLVMVSNLRGSTDTRGFALTDDSKTITEKENFAPVVQNIPSPVAYVDQLYLYSMDISDPDTQKSNISATLLLGPQWLVFNQFVLSGTPGAADITGEAAQKLLFRLPMAKTLLKKFIIWSSKQMSKYLYYLLGLVLLITFVLGALFLRDVYENKQLTELAACTPYNIEFSEQTSASIVVSWTTKSNCTGLVKYGEQRDNIVFVASEVGDSSAKTDHSVNVDNLKAGVEYYLLIISDGKEYGSNGSPVTVSGKD